MSFHHRHHHHSPPSPPPPHHCHSSYSSSCFCSNNSSSSCCCRSSESTSDQLLQALLLLQSAQSPLPATNPRHRHHHYQQQQQSKHHDDDPSLLLHSLARRVAALESSLSSLQPPSPSPARGKHSLKQVAAVTIQRCFRRFLARRSKTLRDLKHLASIKSHAASLRSSLSSGRPRALSRKAMDLLCQLDSIQSSDPMIREGKRSVGKELVRISDFVDKILIREREEEDGAVRVRDSGRRVSFVEVKGGDEDKVFDDLSEILCEEEEAEMTRYCDRSSNGDERVANGDSRNGGLGLSAPLPVKMESRRNGSLKKMANGEEEEED